MQNVKLLCKTCGHLKDKHESDKCNITTHYGKCPCDKYVEIEISDRLQLSKEFEEAWEIYNGFIQSCKGADGVYKTSDFKKAVLIQERQNYLWKELNNY